MSKSTDDTRDEYIFLRRRATQLWDEGMRREAHRLLSAIDREQARRIAAEMEDPGGTVARKKI